MLPDALANGSQWLPDYTDPRLVRRKLRFVERRTWKTLPVKTRATLAVPMLGY
jgi:hypothetical protein